MLKIISKIKSHLNILVKNLFSIHYHYYYFYYDRFVEM